eukprot:CAMPEP_0176403974 /NCGR_PEP_ID=MMETSP0126-20121128/50504_1 /TAXON_ID=141414 ORGANISM="Strombidinopsis acuminatum, Strain SPMC142" /NCGR_SAMPLE_ID=MMETSP0126 /ASSEMBLY_ACC=CAM_ASM_000229 /LENGTH=32 /DNA_ID= /DNA_START= /DNA_END= /DNA_ORIENTATION=
MSQLNIKDGDVEEEKKEHEKKEAEEVKVITEN